MCKNRACHRLKILQSAELLYLLENIRGKRFLFVRLLFLQEISVCFDLKQMRCMSRRCLKLLQELQDNRSRRAENFGLYRLRL